FGSGRNGNIFAKGARHEICRTRLICPSGKIRTVARGEPTGRRDVGAFLVVARRPATKQSTSRYAEPWIASRSPSSGAHSRDLLARNDGKSQDDAVIFCGCSAGIIAKPL